MPGNSVVRVGLNTRLKLEVPQAVKVKLREPFSASVALLADGRVRVTYWHDPDGSYHWGQYNDHYGYWPLEMQAGKVTYDSPEAADLRFTYTPAEQHQVEGDRLVVTLPADRQAPRPYRRAANPKLTKQAPPRVAEPEPAPAAAAAPQEQISAELAEPLTQRLDELMRGNAAPAPGWITPAITPAPYIAPTASLVDRADVRHLVAALNKQLAGNAKLSVQLRAGRVVVTEEME